MRAPVTISSEAEPEIAIGRFEPCFVDAPRGRDRWLDRSELTLYEGRNAKVNRAISVQPMSNFDLGRFRRH
jgi:hypothetical protein